MGETAADIGAIRFGFDNIRASARRVNGVLAFVVCGVLSLRLCHIVASMARLSAEPAWRVPVFFLLAGIITTGPGLFMLPRVKLGCGNLFLAPTFIISTSLGSTMLVAWALYATGLFTTFAAYAIIVASAGLGLAGLAKMAHNRRGVRPAAYASTASSLIQRLEMSSSEALCLVLSAMLALGMFDAVCGYPFQAWDAMVSWDKWAADIAGRHWAGGYVTGGYPQGVPLIVALLYKLCMPSGADPVLSLEALLAPGIFQIFPLLVSLAILSVARTLRINPLFPFAILFGHGAFATGVVKYAGYVDVPLGAFVASAIALAAALGGERREGMPAGGMELAALASVLFAVAFTKGNGFMALALALAISAVPRCNWNFKGLRPAMAAALLAAGTYYLWQWTIGVWYPSLAETSLFNHSLPVESSHRNLITPDFAHFIRIMRDTWMCYGMKTQLPVAAAVALGIIVPTVPLLARQTRRAAVLVWLLVAIWFFTGSYDMRNLLYLIPAIAIIIPATVKYRLPRQMANVMALTAAIPLLYSVSQTRLPEIAVRPLRRYSPPEYIQLDPDARQARGIGLSEEQAGVLRSSDIVRRAPCIVVMTTRDHYLMTHYRYLFGKGVYPLGGRMYGRSPKSLALLLDFPGWREEGFIPVSSFYRKRGGPLQLLMATPEFAEAPFEIVQLHNGFLEVRIDCGGLEFGNSGIVRLRLADGAMPLEFEVLDQNPAWAGIMRPVHDGDAVSSAFLLGRHSDTLRLKVPEEARIADVSIGW